ncbi:MAG: ABC transporter substrate-binding protein [Spirochaetia bacterium]|jgi:glucose/mannose transport system substrate-binding protein
MKRKIWFFVLVACVALIGAVSVQAQQKLEIFSWWAGDEGPALQALLDKYNELYPNIDVVNATVTGGSGVNARAVLKTRMLGGDPPDSFQVHAGQELIGTWVVANRMEDLTPLYKSEGWLTKFPKGLIALLSSKGGIWSVPVNIHRSNVMWYVPSKLQEWGVTPPKTWDEFLATCKTLQDKGVSAPLVVGESWTYQHLWESVAVGVLGPANWAALWSGKLKFTDPKAVKVWDMFGQVLGYANSDASGLSWQQATDRMINGDAAFNIMGDWAAGYMATTLKKTPGEDFGWAPSPGTRGVFLMLSDSFGLPKGIKDRPSTMSWLKLLGSKDGQDIFNPLKGSIAARLDSDLTKYNAYSQSAAKDWKSNTIAGSLVHGVVAPESFMSQFGTVMDIYLAAKDSKAAANAAQAIADQVGLGK